MTSEAATGHCLCGKVEYTITEAPVMAINCHCKNCQRQSGSAFSSIIGVPQSGVSIAGDFKTYEDHGETGKQVLRDFCGACGSPLFSRVEAAPGLIFVKVGTLDDTRGFMPAMHLWTSSKQHWVDLADTPAFETNPA